MKRYAEFILESIESIREEYVTIKQILQEYLDEFNISKIPKQNQIVTSTSPGIYYKSFVIKGDQSNQIFIEFYVVDRISQEPVTRFDLKFEEIEKQLKNEFSKKLEGFGYDVTELFRVSTNNNHRKHMPYFASNLEVLIYSLTISV